jgi:hypothetical protein
MQKMINLWLISFIFERNVTYFLLPNVVINAFNKYF